MATDIFQFPDSKRKHFQSRFYFIPRSLSFSSNLGFSGFLSRIIWQYFEWSRMRYSSSYSPKKSDGTSQQLQPLKLSLRIDIFSGWLASHTYAIGWQIRDLPSEHIISLSFTEVDQNFHSILASTSWISWWYLSCVLSSFLGGNTGSKAMGTIAKELGEFWILAGRFPIVKYNGHTFLLPE